VIQACFLRLRRTGSRTGGTQQKEAIKTEDFSVRNLISKIDLKPERKSETYCFLRLKNWKETEPIPKSSSRHQ
jgi:hypothetical protein